MTREGQRVVLITGCSSGIGRALAEEFLDRGDRVAATARNPESLDGLAGDRCLILSLDVTDAAVALLARLGYDPAMGARPVRRTIDQRIVNPLAELLLASEATGERTLRVDADGEDITLDLA